MPECTLWISEDGDLVMDEDGNLVMSEACPCGECCDRLIRWIIRHADRILCPGGEGSNTVVTPPAEGSTDATITICGENGTITYDPTLYPPMTAPTCEDPLQTPTCDCVLITSVFCPMIDTYEGEDMVPRLYPIIAAPDPPSDLPSAYERCSQKYWNGCFSAESQSFVTCAAQVIAPLCWFDDAPETPEGQQPDMTLVWGVVGCYCGVSDDGKKNTWEIKRLCGGATPGRIVVKAPFKPDMEEIELEDGSVGTIIKCELTCEGTKALVEEMATNHYAQYAEITPGFMATTDAATWYEWTGRERPEGEHCFWDYIGLTGGYAICCQQLDEQGILRTASVGYVFDCDCALRTIDASDKVHCSGTRGASGSSQDGVVFLGSSSTRSGGSSQRDYCGECADLWVLQEWASQAGWSHSPDLTDLTVITYDGVDYKCATNSGTGGVIVEAEPRYSAVYQISGPACLYAAWSSSAQILVWIDCNCEKHVECLGDVDKIFVSHPGSCVCTDWREIVDANPSTFGVVQKHWWSNTMVEFTYTDTGGNARSFNGAYWCFTSPSDEIPWTEPCDECDLEQGDISGVDVWGGFLDYNMLVVKRQLGVIEELGHVEKGGGIRNLRMEAANIQGCEVSNASVTQKTSFLGGCICDVSSGPTSPGEIIGCGSTHGTSSQVPCGDSGIWCLLGHSYASYARHGSSIPTCRCQSYQEYNPDDDDYVCPIYRERRMSPDMIYMSADEYLCVRPNIAFRVSFTEAHEVDMRCPDDRSYWSCYFEASDTILKYFCVQYIPTSCGLYLIGDDVSYLMSLEIPTSSQITSTMYNKVSGKWGYCDNVPVIRGSWPSYSEPVEGYWVDGQRTIGADNSLVDYTPHGNAPANVQPPMCHTADHCMQGGIYSDLGEWCSHGAAEREECTEDMEGPTT